MQNNKFDFKTGVGFPWQFKLVAIFLIAVSFAVIPSYPAISAILSFIALLIFTTRSGVEIDLEKKYYREYMSYFFVIRTGKPYSFDSIDYLFINSGDETERIYTAHTSSSKSFSYGIYNLFLKLDNDEKIKLLTSKNKNDLLKQAYLINYNLKTELKDYTEPST